MIGWGITDRYMGKRARVPSNPPEIESFLLELELLDPGVHVHPLLVPMLAKHGLSYALFHRRGRPPKSMPELRAKRAAIITELHVLGTPWARMMEITGLSNGAIQRLTGAMWNPASKQNLRDNCAKVGRAGKGWRKPQFSLRLKSMWANGTFDFHRGRVRSPEECAALRASVTPERRATHSRNRLLLWKQPSFREPLLAFHRSPEERARRSQAQSHRMLTEPQKWTWGIGCYMAVTKCSNGPCIWVRSTWEKAAVQVLESDPEVLTYTYEMPCPQPDGKTILPDFVVVCSTHTTLVEVKAAWVLGMPTDHRHQVRLQKSREEATHRGWEFQIWTEKDVLHDALRT